MSHNLVNDIWLVGVGYMGREYAKVLKALEIPYQAIGRGKESANEFHREFATQVKTGGLERFLASKPEIPEWAILAVDDDIAAESAVQLVESGVKNLLLEKPAGLSSTEITTINEHALEHKANVFVAYNRRFYSSVIEAQRIIDEDGGLRSMTFEFTEWAHKIEPLPTNDRIKAKWLIANSSHVIDLAFYVGGRPQQLQCFTGGTLNWHPSGSKFVGAGVTETNVPFSYFADWGAPGRWVLELCSNNYRLIFKPLESLKIQQKGSVEVKDHPIHDELDTKYKPGLYRMTQAFLNRDWHHICSMQDQVENMAIYEQIASYKS